MHHKDMVRFCRQLFLQMPFFNLCKILTPQVPVMHFSLPQQSEPLVHEHPGIQVMVITMVEG
ncbi:33023_t:CDS:1, partial [Racocetra persica]